jgi:Calcium-dependent channel, 7TM region, putative phosphate
MRSLHQATYFIQIVFVSTAISIGLEMLRVQPLVMALIRSFLPPNLTEEERQTTVFGMFRPLADPDDFGHAANLAQVVLNFIIMLVYAVIAPLTVFIQAFCFVLVRYILITVRSCCSRFLKSHATIPVQMFVCFKHQFVYIYPSHPDSGGKIWTNFVSVLLPCLLIAEFTSKCCGMSSMSL